MWFYVLPPLGVIMLVLSIIAHIEAEKEFKRTRLPTIEMNFIGAFSLVFGGVALLVWCILFLRGVV